VQAQRDHLDVHPRALRANGLDSVLVELSEPPGLGPLGPEHGPEVEQFRKALGLMEVMLEVGPDHGGGALRPQDDVVAAAVFESEHLLLDDVGGLADRAEEERGIFNDGGAQFLVAVGSGESPGGAFDR